MLYISPLSKPLTGGAAQYLELVKQSCVKSDIKFVSISEYVSGQKVYTRGLRSIEIRILPKRDQLPFKTPIYDTFSYLVTFFFIATLLLFFKIFRASETVILHGRYRNGLFRLIPLVNKRTLIDVRDAMFTKRSYLPGLRFICCAQHIEEKINTLFDPLEVHYFPTPVDFPGIKRDFNRSKNCDNGKDVDVLFVGANSKFKGIDLFVRYLTFVCNDICHPNKCRTLVVGSPTKENSLLLSALPLQVELVQHSALARPDLLCMIARSNLVFCASSHEGIPRIAIEALYLGTKCVIAPEVYELISCSLVKTCAGDEDFINVYEFSEAANADKTPHETSRVLEKFCSDQYPQFLRSIPVY